MRKAQQRDFSKIALAFREYEAATPADRHLSNLRAIAFGVLYFNIVEPESASSRKRLAEKFIEAKAVTPSMVRMAMQVAGVASRHGEICDLIEGDDVIADFHRIVDALSNRFETTRSIIAYFKTGTGLGGRRPAESSRWLAQSMKTWNGRSLADLRKLQGFLTAEIQRRKKFES